ncbi:hypothetical protein SAMN04487770_12367 [Butyrivibrio sp. ob235]|uniref:hypothetical protein n=1 Tax=Butyrivibrio sp. ob235 TaxID=1761780 RepID=UPI0008C7B225|nr:hypothetical protein [Butyrivibrio sp. ob235]SEM01965.1 hypothetical protein SAMN04487770_12367 [Butyrivibrio sp. ob235]
MNMVDEKYLDEIKEDLKQYTSGERIPTIDDAISECHAVVIRSVFDAFGLGAFGDKIGGSVTTIHNFEKGITANNEEFVRYQEYKKGYDSKEVRPQFTNTQKKIRTQIIKDAAKSGEEIISGYTGNELPLDGRAQLEHIISVEEIYSDPGVHLAFDLEGKKSLVYDSNNLTMLESYINQSKGGAPLKEWLYMPNANDKTLTNAEYYKVDIEKALKLDKQARLAYKINRAEGIAMKQMPELLINGMEHGQMLGRREVIAAILIDLYDALVPAIKRIIEKKKRNQLTWDEFFEEIKAAAISIKDKLLNDWSEFIKIYFTGYKAGIISELVTFIINCVLTTVKNVVTIIRETLFCFYRIAQIKKNKVLTEEEKNEAITKLLISTFSICLTCLLGEAIHKLLIEVPMSAEISQALSSIVVGVVIVMVTYLVISMQEEMLSLTANGVDLGIAMLETVNTHELRVENAAKRMHRLDESRDTK